MTVGEVAEAAVIEAGSTAMDTEMRFTNPSDLLFRGCENLFVITGDFLGLSHYSVQEYLKSDRIRQGPARFFAINEPQAAEKICRTCLTYIAHDDFNGGPSQSTCDFEARLKSFPFLDYAANHWFHYAGDETVQEGIFDLFDQVWDTCTSPKYLSWFQVFCDRSITLQRKFGTYQITNPSILYFPALWGLRLLCRRLLLNGNTVNGQGGYYGNPLQAAAINRHYEMVELLLENGAEINQAGGYFGSALQAATNSGGLAITQMLLQHGADVTASGGAYGNALQAAARNGHVEIVDLFISVGADVNAKGGPFGYALQAAANNGHENVAELLIEKGALINAQGGAFGNALQAAKGLWSSYYGMAPMQISKADSIPTHS